MRRTVASLTPISAAIVRVLQWVALAGLDWVVLRINVSLTLAAIEGLRPGRGASFSKPGIPSRKKRFRQREAFWLLMPSISAISVSGFPSAASSTILARSTCRAGSDRERDHCFKTLLDLGFEHERSGQGVRSFHRPDFAGEPVVSGLVHTDPQRMGVVGEE